MAFILQTNTIREISNAWWTLTKWKVNYSKQKGANTNLSKLIMKSTAEYHNHENEMLKFKISKYSVLRSSLGYNLLKIWNIQMIPF